LRSATEPASRLRRRRVVSAARYVAIVALVALLCASPLVITAGYYRYASVLVVMYMMMSTSWNLVGGFTGYVSLGHAAFFGLGAYGTALGVTDLDLPHAAALALSAIGTVAFAAVVGWAAVRVRGASFVIVSVALVAMMSLIAQEARSLTGGSSGLRVPPLSEDLDRTTNHVLFFYLFGAVLALALVAWRFVDRSRFGAGLKAIREDEDKAGALGVPTTAYKVVVFAVSAGFAALVGGLYGVWFGNLDPVFVFSVILGVNMVLMALFGGVRHLFGPLVGALVIAPAGEYFLTNHGETQLHVVLSGALLAVVVLFMPDGVIPAVRSLLRRFGPAAASIREETQSDLRDQPDRPAREVLT
jgi:branched-chain amino acid transport system permease protein